MVKGQSPRAIRGHGWASIFAQIDPILEDFAKTRSAQVTKYHWDAPDRMLQWEADGAARRVHVYVSDASGNHLAFEYSAWVDETDDVQGTRHWKLEKLSEDLPVESITYKLESYLQKAYDQALARTKHELLKSGNHSPLTSLPGS